MTEPRIISVDVLSPDETVISRAASILESGSLIVAPTETRYGLLARADRPESIEKMYRVKARRENLPTALFVKSIEQLSDFGFMSGTSRSLAERFLPGALTLVLKAVRDLGAPLVVNGRIGLRFSPAPVIRMLVERLDFPLTATSANPSGKPDCENVAEIAEDFGDAIELYLDGGELTGPVSTVLDVSEDTPKVLRAGAITEAEIGVVLKSQLA